MEVDRYLERIGVDSDSVTTPDFETLGRLQRAHVTSVPFETLSVTGDSYGERGPGEPVLDPSAIYEKIVERGRGGWCFECNGLFGWLLTELGFDVTRIAARVVSDDGQARPPANHHPLLVEFDRPYVVDVGMGTPTMRRPTPLGGESTPDEAGVRWRIVESDRPDAEYRSQFRYRGEDGWTDRYVFTTTPRDLGFFEATCEFLARAPESPFTGDPTVSVATDRGHLKLSPDALTWIVDGQEREEPIDESGWYEALEDEFGLSYP